MRVVFTIFLLMLGLLGQGKLMCQEYTGVFFDDYMRYDIHCKDYIIESGLKIKDALSSEDDQIEVGVALIYPLGLYMNKTDGLNAAVKVYIDHLVNRPNNYLVYLVKVNDETGHFETEIHHRLKTRHLSHSCESKLKFILDIIDKDLRNKANPSDRILAAGCRIKDSMEKFAGILEQDCTVSDKDRRAWFESKEFENYKLPGFQLDYGSGIRRPIKLDQDESNRNTCGIADYTQGDLKLQLADNQLESISWFLSTLETYGPRRLIITDKYISDYLLDSIYKKEILNPSCYRVVWLHFSDTGENSQNEVFIRIANQFRPGYDEQSYTFEKIKEDYKNNSGIFGPSLKINWRLKDFKDDIISFCKYNQNVLGVPSKAMSSIEYIAGLMSGMVDEIIETADMMHIIVEFAKSAIQLNAGYNPASLSFWGDLMLKCITKRNLYEALAEKTNETYENWLGLYTAFTSLYETITDEKSKMEFFESISKITSAIMTKAAESVSKFASDFVFNNETYDAGYAHGIVVMSIIPVNILLKGIKTGIQVASVGSSTVKNIIANLVANISKKQADDVVKVIAKNTSILLKKLGTKSVAWYRTDMPAAIKTSLMDMIEKGTDTKYFPALEKDLVRMPKLNGWLTSQNKIGLDSWRYLNDVYPNKTWCLP